MPSHGLRACQKYEAMEDEDILLLAGAEVEAFAYLTLRHHVWMERWVARRCRAFGMRPDDVLDAQQLPPFVVKEAVVRLCSAAEAPPGRFRQFLRRLLHDRFLDFRKSLCRAESHFDRSAAARKAVQEICCDPRGDFDPAAVAQRQEEWRLLQQALARLCPAEKSLWELLVQEGNLTIVAVRLEIAYVTARRRLKKLLGKLNAQFREL